MLKPNADQRFVSILILCLLMPGTLTDAPAQSGSSTPGHVQVDQDQPRKRERLAEARRLNQQALSLSAEGKYDAAMPLATQSLSIIKTELGSKNLDFAIATNNLAEIFRLKGDYTQAEPLYVQTLDTLKKLFGTENPHVAAALNNFALLQQAKGDYVRALSLLQEALTIREKVLGPENPDVANSLNNIAALHQIRGDYASAEPLHRRALVIFEKTFGPDHQLVATSLNNLAEINRVKGNLGEAEELFRRVLAIYEKKSGNEHPSVANTLNNLALLYHEKGDYVAAEKTHQTVLDIREKSLGPNHPDIALTLGNLSILYWTTNQVPQALAALKRSNEIHEHNLRLILQTGSSTQKSLYISKLAGVTDSTVSFNIQAAPHNVEATRLALAVVLQRKGRALDSIANQIGTLRRRLEPQDQMLLDNVSAVSTQLASLTLKGGAGSGGNLLRTELSRLEAEKEKLESQVSTRSAEFGIQSQPITIQRVQHSIPVNGALVEQVLYQPYNPRSTRLQQRFGAPRYAAYVLQREGEPKCIDLGPAADIDRVVSLVRKALVDRGSLNAKEAGRSLDELLMRPVRKLIGETRHILLSPDGLINLLPFSALVDEDGRYLIENYVLSYLTSGRDLLRLDIRGLKSKQGPIVFANPAYEVLDSPSMPSNSANTTTNALLSSSTAQMQWEALEGTEEEANSLKDILSSARIITGTNASEAALKRITAPRILHIATHGFFLPGRFPGDWPLLRSGLVLAGANQRHSGTGEDGLLTALEAAQLDLWGTQLVVLSACQTGLGDIQIGEGVYGLRRALGLAGAESQLMSLWRVDDEATRELMVQYYRRLRDGVGRTEALREVQLGMLRSKSRSHPFFWSGFIPIGDWRMLDRL